MTVAFDGILQFEDRAALDRLMSDQYTIFIVDDNDAVRDSLKLLLESHGCRVHDHRSTREFLDAFRAGDRQCLILDHHLPDQNGLDFLESEEGSRLGLPVIVVTGGGDEGLKARALRAGATAYFDKPLNDAILVSTILTLLKDAT